MNPRLRPLFRRVCLAESGREGIGPPSFGPFLGPQPEWRVVHRFGRFHLGSPETHADRPDYVYFGDDTLALMARGLEAASEMAQGGSPPAVLDLCCGGGGVGRALQGTARSVIGLDIHPQAIELARAVSTAQGSGDDCHYRVADAFTETLPPCDLALGNPPTLPPEIVTRSALFAVGPSDRYLRLIERLLGALSDRGQALFTHFAVAESRYGGDPVYRALVELLAGARPFRYRVRRQLPLAGGGWLRHVLLEIGPAGASAPPSLQVEEAQRGALPGYAYRRLERATPGSG